MSFLCQFVRLKLFVRKHSVTCVAVDRLDRRVDEVTDLQCLLIQRLKAATYFTVIVVSGEKL